jgi:spore coat protein H
MSSRVSSFPQAISILLGLAAIAPWSAGGADETPFIRGDVTADGALAIDDPVALLGHLFLGSAAPTCLDAADVDDSGDLDLNDPMFLIRHLFLGGDPPPEPYSACGLDATPDSLGCAAYPPCAFLIDPSRVHRIEITLSPEDLRAFKDPPPLIWPAPPEPWYPSTFRFDGAVLEQVGIRRKGSSTLYQAAGKYSVSVKFNKFVKGRRLQGLEKIILNNCVLDPTFLNESIGYGIYRRMGLPAARTAHARVSLNGEVQGIYLVVEAIEKDFLESRFGRGNGDGNLYEGPGDFLTHDPNFPDDIKEPELKDEDQGRVRDDLHELHAALSSATQSSFLVTAEARIALNGFINGWAIDSCALHFDGYPGNYYLYHEPVSTRFVFIPHGMDQLFGFREWVDYDPVSGIPIGVPVIHYQPQENPLAIIKGGGLVDRLMEIPEGWRRYQEAVRQVASDGWDVPAILAQIDQAASLIAPLRGEAGAAGADAKLFAASVEDLRTYITERKTYLDSITR